MPSGYVHEGQPCIQALKILSKRGSQRSKESLMCIGGHYVNGTGGFEKNLSKALEIFNFLAAQRDPFAVKVLYAFGVRFLGYPQFEQTDSQTKIAFFYTGTSKISRDLMRGIQYLILSYRFGYQPAFFLLQNLAINLHQKNPRQTFEIFSSIQSQPGARYQLAMCYLYGIGININLEKSTALLKYLLEKGYGIEKCSERLYEVAYLFIIEKNINKAQDIFCFLASKNYLPAIESLKELGDYYQREKKVFQSIDCWKIAARYGNYDAVAQIFKILNNLKTSPRTYLQTLMFLKEKKEFFINVLIEDAVAGQRNALPKLVEMGKNYLCFFKEEAVEQEGLVLLIKAAKLGSVKALYYLKVLSLSNTIVDRSIKKEMDTILKDFRLSDLQWHEPIVMQFRKKTLKTPLNTTDKTMGATFSFRLGAR